MIKICLAEEIAKSCSIGDPMKDHILCNTSSGESCPQNRNKEYKSEVLLNSHNETIMALAVTKKFCIEPESKRIILKTPIFSQKI